MPEIPQKIHFIWLGGNISEKYLNSILGLAEVAKKSGFELNLWLDDEKNYRSPLKKVKKEFITLMGDVPDGQIDKALGMTLRDINELKIRMQGKDADDFYRGTDPDFPLDDQEERANRFWKYVNMERIGSKNLAAASDLLRYEILRQEGGVYFDTDTLFMEINPPLKPSQRLKLPHKSSSHYEKKYVQYLMNQEEWSQYYLHSRIYKEREELPRLEEEFPLLGIKVNAELGLGGYEMLRVFKLNNDIIAATKDHEVLKRTLCFSLENYKKREENLYPSDLIPYTGYHFKPYNKKDKKSLPITEMDIKRLPDPLLYKIREKATFNRRELTIITAGPDALKNALVEQFKDKDDFSSEELNSLTIKDASTPNRILGIAVHSAYENTWLKTKTPKSYDLDSIPDGFFSHPKKQSDSNLIQEDEEKDDSKDYPTSWHDYDY